MKSVGEVVQEEKNVTASQERCGGEGGEGQKVEDVMMERDMRSGERVGMEAGDWLWTPLKKWSLTSHVAQAIFEQCNWWISTEKCGKLFLILCASCFKFVSLYDNFTLKMKMWFLKRHQLRATDLGWTANEL